MGNLNKRDLIDRLTERTGFKRGDVKTVVQALIDTVMEEMASGNRIELRGFGVFEVKERAARSAQNPRTLQRFVVPPRPAVRFKPGQQLRDCAARSPRRPGARSRDGQVVKREPPLVEVGELDDKRVREGV